MKLIFAIPILLVTRYVTVLGNHLPEDKLRDDGVALVREKRDNFIDRILKSIPFFHMSSPTNVLEEEQVEPFANEDDDDAADDDDDDDVNTTLTPLLMSTVMASFTTVPSSVVMSANLPISATPYSDAAKQSVLMSTDSISSTPVLVDSTPPSSLPTTEMIQTTPAIFNSVAMTSAMSTGELLESFMSANAPPTDAGRNSTSAQSASIASMMSVSGVVAASPSSIASTVSAFDDTEPVIKMMIMAGEPALRVQDYGARLPDERGFSDGIGRNDEDIDVKNIRFMYASVLVPVMSGLVGALLITFGILIFKCVKRRRLKKVRYYGAKPGSGLYRLDQIGLLSDMSSDEE